ncbi:tRNA lysidine(34) synthetase TilS [Vagococcus xieshaowenii]|nr:tRNA lysidine(34) synthetase TilS [Vagococcus xieshaowenii]
MERAFRKIIEASRYWQKEDHVLIAVSGGVDSMVLLRLMERLPSNLSPGKIGVAHFDHQLRASSFDEAKAVAYYCKQHDLPYHRGIWDNQVIEDGVEASARKARYTFLLETARNYGYTTLLTAHHGDDQVETLLIKMIRGSSLPNMVGIRPVSYRDTIKLVRPLLSFNKETIQQWADQQSICFWEDESNKGDDYLRNRLRHHIVPQIAKEAPNYVEKWSDFSYQLHLANELIHESIQPVYEACLVNEADGIVLLDVEKWSELSQAKQYFVLTNYFQEELITKGGQLSQRQLQMMMKDLKVAGEQVWHLSNGWYVKKTYQFLKLSQKEQESPDKKEWLLSNVGQTIQVDNDEQFVLTKDSSEKNNPFELQVSPSWLPLRIRYIQEGDRLKLDALGHTKKVSRFFIDEKIPREERKKIPLVVNNQGEVIWIVGFRKSYLSIALETDKIFYKLTYSKNE